MSVQEGSISIYFRWSADLMCLQVWGFGFVGFFWNFLKYFFLKNHVVSGSFTSPNIPTGASGKKLAAHSNHQFYTSHCKQLEIAYSKPATLQGGRRQEQKATRHLLATGPQRWPHWRHEQGWFLACSSCLSPAKGRYLPSRWEQEQPEAGPISHFPVEMTKAGCHVGAMAWWLL